TDLIRELGEAQRSQILAISTLDLQEQALAAGAHAFLGKPLEPLRLVSTVRDLLGTSALARPGSDR
ncbi:MAG: response regulator, partial [Candidatus Dormibacteraeota bacterium]|nr:response regulator [Candidatus Dormibacteraeota bacterium]